MDIEYQKTNREKRLTPVSKGKYWCGCDMNLVFVSQKCHVCGKRAGKITLKKEQNAS